MNVETESFDEISQKVFSLMSQHVGINTFFIAKNDGIKVDVVQTLNRKYSLLETGFTIDFQQSF